MGLMARIFIQRAVKRAIITTTKKFDIVIAVKDAIPLPLNKDSLLYSAVKKLKSFWISGNGKACLHKFLIGYSVKTVASDGYLEILLTKTDPFIAILAHRVKRDKQKEKC